MYRQLTVLAGAALMLGACQSAQDRAGSGWNPKLRSGVNAWTITSLQDKQIAAGVVRGRALLAHHFKPGSPELNERGHRDLTILADHFGEVGEATLILPRGETDQSLYEARRETVAGRLVRAGIQRQRITLVDALPTGAGMESTRAAAAYNEPSAENPYNLHGNGQQE